MREMMNLHARDALAMIQTYKRLSLEIDRGAGAYLYDHNGNSYLDLFSGLGVNSLGYCHPKIVGAIEDQIRKYNHLSNLFVQKSQIELAESLIKYSGCDRVFFSNSGTEAIEGSIKLVRKWGIANNKTELISFSGGFHGRTMGALSIMAQEKYRNGYGPFLEGCRPLPYNDPVALESALGPDTCAVFLEFIQGEAGIIPASDEFVETIFKLKDKYRFLVVADEIQTGAGRTGEFLCFQHWNVQPDIIVMAKAIGGGLPLGAILVKENLASMYGIGQHGSTFGGNPVACAAGVAFVDVLMGEGVLQNSKDIGEYFILQLKTIQNKYPDNIKEVRGKGLMIGIQLDREGEPYVNACLSKNLLINVTQGNILRLLPPLILTKEQVDFAVSIISDVFREKSTFV